ASRKISATELALPSRVRWCSMPARSIAARSTRPGSSSPCLPKMPVRSPSALAQPSWFRMTPPMKVATEPPSASRSSAPFSSGPTMRAARCSRSTTIEPRPTRWSLSLLGRRADSRVVLTATGVRRSHAAQAALALARERGRARRHADPRGADRAGGLLAHLRENLVEALGVGARELRRARRDRVARDHTEVYERTLEARDRAAAARRVGAAPEVGQHLAHLRHALGVAGAAHLPGARPL